MSDDVATISYVNQTTNNNEFLTEENANNGNSSRGLSMEDAAYARVAYVVMATLVLASSVLFIVTYFKNGPTCLFQTNENNRTSKDDKSDVGHGSKEHRSFIISFLVLIFIFYYFCIWLDCIPGYLLAVFVVNGLGWPNKYGALVTSVYFGAHGLGRLLGIPLSFGMSPRNILIMDIVLAAVGLIMLLFVNIYQHIVWISVVIFGIGAGSMFATGMLWAECYIEITAASAATMQGGAAIGKMTGPVMTGLLMDKFTYMSFVYILLGANSAVAIIFTVIIVYVRKMGIVRFRTLIVNGTDKTMKEEMKTLKSSEIT